MRYMKQLYQYSYLQVWTLDFDIDVALNKTFQYDISFAYFVSVEIFRISKLFRQKNTSFKPCKLTVQQQKSILDLFHVCGQWLVVFSLAIWPHLLNYCYVNVTPHEKILAISLVEMIRSISFTVLLKREFRIHIIAIPI